MASVASLGKLVFGKSKGSRIPAVLYLGRHCPLWGPPLMGLKHACLGSLAFMPHTAHGSSVCIVGDDSSLANMVPRPVHSYWNTLFTWDFQRNHSPSVVSALGRSIRMRPLHKHTAPFLYSSDCLLSAQTCGRSPGIHRLALLSQKSATPFTCQDSQSQPEKTG